MKQTKATSQNFFASPFLTSQEGPSPYLSPFPNPFRKHSEAFEELYDFRLQQQPLEEDENNQQYRQIIKQQDLILEGNNANNFSNQLNQNKQQFQEVASPNKSIHFEVSSTKFLQIKQEHQPPFFMLRLEHQGGTQVENMIQFLVQHSKLKEENLYAQSRQYTGENPMMQKIFKILQGKFKKLHKTKQQMTKYCMRKAFKFIADKTRKDKAYTRDLDNCMKQYFSESTQSINFTIPFKKHSTQKTMNGNFLKRIFSCQNFAEDYREFLRQFQSLIIEDNQKKVRYLAQMIEEAIHNGQIDSIQKIKRLPWTQEILRQVYELAISLAQNSQNAGFGRPNRRYQ